MQERICEWKEDQEGRQVPPEGKSHGRRIVPHITHGNRRRAPEEHGDDDGEDGRK